MDIVTYCDVNTCEDCPRYGDDCDGDKRVEHTDLISRADAIEAVDNTDWYHINKNGEMVQGATSEMEAWYKAEDIYKALESLPSADTEPKRVLQGYCKGANTIKTIRHEELTQIANTRKAVESADAVQGEWIWRTDIPIGDGRTSAGYICSNCGKDYWHGNVFNYCPNCGTRMVKGGDDE